MMQHPGIQAEDCLNWETCGSRQQQTEEERQEEIELIRIREEARLRWLEENPHFRRQEMDLYRLNWQQAAMLMLMARGNPQTTESLGLTPVIDHLTESLNVVRQQMDTLEGQYIAPEGCEHHTYRVKRPSRPELRERGIPEDEIRQRQRVFEYHKLSSPSPMFRPNREEHFNTHTRQWERTESVNVLHLGISGNPKNLEAQKGIDRRNTLRRMRTLLENADALLREAATLALESFPEALPPIRLERQDGNEETLTADRFWE